jgi:hypothetical protein
MCCSGMTIGTNPLFRMLMCKPDNVAKFVRTFMIVWRLCGCAGVKIIVSSTNCNIFCLRLMCLYQVLLDVTDECLKSLDH